MQTNNSLGDIMVNQDPQPEVFETTLSFSAADGVGTSITNTIYTHQGHNEDVRIYAITAQFLTTAGADCSDTTNAHFNMELIAGANPVPSNEFDLTWITQSNDKTCPFSVPVIIKFKQPLQVKVIMKGPIALAAATNVKIQLIGETAVIKV